MRYFKLSDETGNITAFGKNDVIGEEITEEEYNTLSTEFRTKIELVNKLYSGEITISDVPEEWQGEIQRRVDRRIANRGTAEEQELSAEEALNIILGGEV